MKVYNLQNTPAAASYRGCGKAWLAVSPSGEPLKLIYMDAHQIVNPERVPDRRYKSGYRLKFRDTTLEFGEFRSRSKEELSKLGSVKSGMASCYEFISWGE